jgi:uncharacterized protein
VHDDSLLREPRHDSLNALHRFSIHHPVLVVALALAVTTALAPGIVRLKLRTDGQALVPQQAPTVRFDREVRREFGVHDPIVVLVRARQPGGIVDAHALRLVADLTRALAHLPGVDSTGVRSLATEPSDRYRERSLDFARLLEPVPTTRAELDRLRGDLEAYPLLTGTFVSFDRAATAILVSAPLDADRTALVASIEGAVARADTAGYAVHVIGASVAEALLGAHILEDLGRGVRPGELSGGDRRPSLLSRVRFAIARHIGLLPLSILVMALVFLVWFRSLIATLLPLAEAAACLVAVFGAMGWLCVPVYLTMAVLPVILVSMGLADELHVFHTYRLHRAARPDAPPREVVRTAMDEMARPVIATALTTAVGFLSFSISPLEPVRAFGIFAAAGIAFCMVWTLTAIPALLVLLAPRGLDAPAPAVRGSRSGLWSRIATPFVRHPVATLVVTVLALAASVPGVRRVVVQDSWISGFARDSDFYRATSAFNAGFFGTHRLLLVLDAGRIDRTVSVVAEDLGMNDIRLPPIPVLKPEALPGCLVIFARRAGPPASQTALMPNPGGGASAVTFELPTWWGALVDSASRANGHLVVKTPIDQGSARFLLMPAPGETLDVTLRSYRLATPGVLHSIDDLERFVREERGLTVGGALGPPDQIVAAEYASSDRDPESRGIPKHVERVQWLYGALERVQGRERVREWVDPERRRGLVTVFLKHANFVDTARLMEAIRGYARERLAPQGIRLDFAGDVAVSQTLIRAIVDSQVRSLVFSLLGILIVIAVLFRSLRWGTVCMLPAGFAVAATFAFLGWTGTPLGVATSMFASMVLGVGVDFAIHLVARFRALVAEGAGTEDAIDAALTATAPAIVVNALAVALGFGLLVLSRVPANARLGEIAVVSLIACLAATLLVIPALLRLMGGRGKAEAEAAPATSAP